MVNEEVRKLGERCGGDRTMLCTGPSEASAFDASRALWEQRLRTALEHGGLALHVQPILNLKTLRFEQYEILVRLADATGRLILPKAFLGVAEQTGLIRRIDRWVLRQALQLVAREARQGRELTVHVNLSDLTFTDEDLSAWIQQELDAAGVPPSRLVLEIRATRDVSDLQRARGFVETLKALECRWALDDFGVAPALIRHLEHLPVDYVKIDGHFIRHSSHNPADGRLVQAAVKAAARLGIQTVAEYVEDRQTLEKLQHYGVDFAQGYYVGPPVPQFVLEFEAFDPFTTPEGSGSSPEHRPVDGTSPDVVTDSIPPRRPRSSGYKPRSSG